MIYGCGTQDVSKPSIISNFSKDRNGDQGWSAVPINSKRIVGPDSSFLTFVRNC